MKEEIRTMLHEHVAAITYLTRQQVQMILDQYPELLYSGEGYRALSFTDQHREMDISQDICFTKNEQSIKNISYLFEHDFIQVYKVQITGIDLSKCRNFFGHFSDETTVSREQEVLASNVWDATMIFNGNVNDYFI